MRCFGLHHQAGRRAFGPEARCSRTHRLVGSVWVAQGRGDLVIAGKGHSHIVQCRRPGSFRCDRDARGKPHPDLFLRAALEMGVDRRKCLVLEDSYNGVRAANAAGMRVVMVPDLLCANPEMCALSEAVVPSLFAVLDALAGAGLSTG